MSCYTRTSQYVNFICHAYDRAKMSLLFHGFVNFVDGEQHATFINSGPPPPLSHVFKIMSCSACFQNMSSKFEITSHLVTREQNPTPSFVRLRIMSTFKFFKNIKGRNKCDIQTCGAILSLNSLFAEKHIDVACIDTRSHGCKNNEGGKKRGKNMRRK